MKANRTNKGIDRALRLAQQRFLRRQEEKAREGGNPGGVSESVSEETLPFRLLGLEFRPMGSLQTLLAVDLACPAELVQRCRGCGCTDFKACVTESGPCYWVEPGLCSGCATGGDDDD